jgi:hypothetical protein
MHVRRIFVQPILRKLANQVVSKKKLATDI